MAEFVEWKEQFERETYCTYRSADYRHKLVYRCHRNGYYKPVDQRRRKAPVKGYKKLNGFCPSKLKLVPRNDDSGGFELEVVKTHIGHQPGADELTHVRISSMTKSRIATLLKRGLPICEVMEELKMFDEDGKKLKESTITSDDIRNVQRSMNINNDGIIPSDVLAIQASNIENSENVLYFKKRGEIDPKYPLLDEQDYVVIMMNKPQMENLLKFGSNVICLDSVHSSSDYEFILHSALVANEYYEGYPCCFVLTNRSDQLPINIMLYAIKEQVGQLRPKIFMSDIQPTYIIAWQNIMQTKPDVQLYSPWHVRKDWEYNINTHIRIGKTKAAVREELKNLHEEVDKNEFMRKLDRFLRNDDPNRREFIEYFQNEYFSHYEQWASCYRQMSGGMNLNQPIEHFRNIIPEVYRKGERITSIEDVRTILYDRVMHNIIGKKLENKRNEMRQAHKEALAAIDDVNVRRTNNYYVVSSSETNEQSFKYKVFKNDQKLCANGDEKECRMKCVECNACLHDFRCTCKKNSKRNIMCEHIHLVLLKKINVSVYEVCTVVPTTETASSPVSEVVFVTSSLSSSELPIEDTSVDFNNSETTYDFLPASPDVVEIDSLSPTKLDEPVLMPDSLFGKLKECLTKEYEEIYELVNTPEKLNYLREVFGKVKEELSASVVTVVEANSLEESQEATIVEFTIQDDVAAFKDKTDVNLKDIDDIPLEDFIDDE